MTVAMLWVLITISSGVHSEGVVTNVGYFVKQVECEKIKQAILFRAKGQKASVDAVCEQAEVVVVK